MNEPLVAQIVTATRLLAGKPLQAALLAQVKEVLEHMQAPVRLAVVLVGDHPASQVYVARKAAAAERAGLKAEVLRLPAHTGEQALHATLHGLAQDAATTGILLQLPLPDGWNVQAALDIIPPAKDVDGLTTVNQSARTIWPATPLAVMRLLAHAGINVKGLKACVIGRSTLVGTPLAELLKRAGAVVDTIAKDTPRPQAICREADLVCVAAGVPGLVDARWLKPAATVIDIGITRTANGLLGDVQAEGDHGVLGHAALLTPVPGGVGPLTVASLLTNAVDAALMQHGNPPHRWVIPPL